MIRLSYNGVDKDYPFNVTLTNNTEPYFPSPIPTQYANVGFSSNITLPAIADDEGDAAIYDLKDPGVTFNYEINGKRNSNNIYRNKWRNILP